MKPIINVVQDAAKPIEGKEYYYINDEKSISKGTAVSCEKCGKWCNSNSVTIINFPSSVKSVKVNINITTDELGYDEETDECLCSSCC